MNKFSKLILRYFAVVFLALSSFAYSMEHKAPYKIGDIEVDENFLRKVALSIFSREQQIENLKNKICTHHGQEIFDVWRLNATWGSLSEENKTNLKKKIKVNDIKSILKRPRYALLDVSVIKNPEQFENILQDGHIILDKSPDRNTYGIKVTKTFPQQMLGKIYIKDKTTGELNESPSSTLFITFDIQDIADKINKGGINSWDPQIDGRITTMCVD